jgi:hypothetical protein
VRRSWSNTGGRITVDDVSKIREKYKARQKPFTMDELEPPIKTN